MHTRRTLTLLTAMVVVAGCDSPRSSRGYEASVEILVMPRDVSLDAQSPDSTDPDFFATHIQVIQSPLVIRNAVEQGNLKELPSLAALGEAEQGVEAHIRQSIRVEQVGNGSVMRVRYSGPNQEDCAKVLEAIVLAYQTFLRESFADVSKEAAELIETAQSDIGERLGAARSEYLQFRQKAELQPGSATTAQEKLNTVKAGLTEIEMERAKSEARLEVLEGNPSEASPGQNTDLSRELDALKVELRVLEKQHQKLTAMAGEAEKQAKRVAACEIEDKLKSEEVEQLSNLYEAVIEKLQEVNLVNEYGGYHTEIVAPIEVRPR